MRKTWTVVILLLAFSTPASADYCSDLGNGFANRLDQIADTYDAMADKHASVEEVCKFQRDTHIAYARQIVATTQADQVRCGGGFVKMAKDQLQALEAKHAKNCPGM